MGYRGILAIDLDGTIVHRGLVILRSDLLALRAARDAGLLPVVATGRRVATSRRFARDLGLEDSPLVACDGALVLAPAGDGQPWRAEEVPRTTAARVADLCRRHGVSVGFSTRQGLFVQAGAAALHPWRHLWRRGALRSPGRLRRALWDLTERRLVRERFDAMSGPAVYKIDLFGPGSAEARVWLDEEIQGVQETAPVGPLELVATGVSKASAIDVVLRRLQLDWGDVIAVGNDWNDLEMIERAGFGVAMADAPRVVREAARFVTGSVREGGVGQAIEAYLGLLEP